eukprot:04191.XXX_162852_162965_1 [CDS] Oithona nana genome sequencing.
MSSKDWISMASLAKPFPGSFVDFADYFQCFELLILLT